MDMIKLGYIKYLIVVNEHTLAYTEPLQRHEYFYVLHASILRGSPYPKFGGHMIFPTHNIRLATAKDFEDYKVCFEGFDDTKEYFVGQ